MRRFKRDCAVALLAAGADDMFEVSAVGFVDVNGGGGLLLGGRPNADEGAGVPEADWV